MNNETLNRLLSSVGDYQASDLHLIAGVPPAFRVNGEIIIADQDALTEEQIDAMAGSLLNEPQRQKFEQDWELCISILHSAAGRVRATFYRRLRQVRRYRPAARPPRIVLVRTAPPDEPRPADGAACTEGGEAA